MMSQQNISIISNKDDKDLFICECQSPEHIMSVYYDGDENHPLVYFNIHLKKLPWQLRIIQGVKYIFGRQSKYGAFDEFIFDNKDVPKLEKIVSYLKKSSE